ncbi:uncharacterized protein PG998_002752 [Apiospora kogelbergensis]|uniref:uncharacterized protein n=1 Tax=Apiospora kogelbergensis TaxID=1337665 RepID=UPI003130553A
MRMTAPKPPSDKEAIVRICSYHRDDFSRLVVHSSPEEMEAVQYSLRAAFSTPPMASLGILEQLPDELIAMIIPQLDIHSYFRFRQLNRRARLVSAEYLKEYTIIAAHGLEGPARPVTRQSRPPLHHHRPVPHPHHPRLSAMRRIRGLPAEELSLLSTTMFYKCAGVRASEAKPYLLASTLRTVPGHYARMTKPAKRNKYLISVEAALEALAAHEVVCRPNFPPVTYSRDDPSVERRRMACTALPWYDPLTAEIERGVNCKGCLRRDNGGMMRAIERAKKERSFSREGFLDHFDNCWRAKDVWNENLSLD